MGFKYALVTPLLKKTNLDKENPSNYRPISNLSFLSKLTERIVLARLNDYLSSNSLLNPHQSGFTKHHSTETLLVSLYNKLVAAVSHQRVPCLCLLDISAAFDTIDHIDFLLGLASLELLYSGSNHIYLLGNSLSKSLTTPHNPSHAPVGSLKAPSWIRSSSFYTPHR